MANPYLDAIMNVNLIFFLLGIFGCGAVLADALHTLRWWRLNAAIEPLIAVAEVIAEHRDGVLHDSVRRALDEWHEKAPKQVYPCLRGGDRRGR